MTFELPEMGHDCPDVFAAYLAHVLGEDNKARDADAETRCDGNRGRCRQVLVWQWFTPAGALVMVISPRIPRPLDELRTIYKEHDYRFKAPNGAVVRCAFLRTIPADATFTTWCTKHGERRSQLPTIPSHR